MKEKFIITQSFIDYNEIIEYTKVFEERYNSYFEAEIALEEIFNEKSSYLSFFQIKKIYVKNH